MTIPNYTPQTFDRSDVASWKQHLDTEGYAVIHNVLEPSDIEVGLEHFWKDWTTVSPGFVRTDPGTWSIQTAPMMFAKGMATFNGFGQSDFTWHVRTQPAIRDIFAKIHDTEDLITSFDGFSVFFSQKQKSPKDWWHIDQHPDNPVYTVQGAYNFFPVTPESAGFTVVPRSHRTFVPSSTKVAKDWIQVHKNKTPEEAAAAVAGGVKLIIPANSFVLWNSKTIHANTGMATRRGATSVQPQPTVLNRLTVYVTYVPRSRRTSEMQLTQRTDAYKAGATTSHWPDKVEVKTYPWGFGPAYEAKGFGHLVPRLDINGAIPAERLMFI
jgi:ectoine hydroxylase-related dioxygenase (phytanoyl-CoA dioxygenase family)